MKSLEPQLVEKEVELNQLRQIIQGFGETGPTERNANTVDTVESYESLGLSHREAVNAAASNLPSSISPRRNVN